MCERFIRLFICTLVLAVALASAAQAADPTLIGWWPMNEEAGEIAYDVSDYGNDATLVGETLAWAPDGGRFGGALSYGENQADYVEILTTNISTVSGTVAIWGYLDADQTSDREHYFFGHTTIPAFNNRIQLYMDVGDTDLDLGLGDDHFKALGMATLDTETWYHVALTWDNGQYVVYLDGEVIQDGSYVDLTTLNDTAAIGNDGNTGGQVEGFKGFLDECRLYNRALSQAEVQAVMASGYQLGLAGDPAPGDEATEILRDAVLSWTAGAFAVTHDVYFGTSFDDVNDADRSNPGEVLVVQDQTETTYDPPGLLEYGQAYYWRIDEVNGAPDYGIYKGQVWSFNTEALAYPIEKVTATASAFVEGFGPENTVNGSGLNADGQHSTDAGDMWQAAATADPVWLQYEFEHAYKLFELQVWNYNVMFEAVLGFGLKGVTIEYSTDGTEWTVLGDVEFAQATAVATYTANTAIDLAGVRAKYVRLTINSAYGAMGYGLSEVRFLYSPVQGRYPDPADEATEVDVNPAMSWRPGRQAVSHEIYLSADEAAVADGTALVDTVTDSSYAPATLDFGQTYYWKVNEVNEAEAVSTWEGDVWSFTTQEFAVIDDFEGYDDETNPIYETWIDGWVNGSGSTAGYLTAPFAERSIVNGGLQSMPLAYDNTSSPYYSEASQTFATARDWTAGAPDSLRLYFYGATDNIADTLYVAIEDGSGQVAVASHSDPDAVLAAEWQEWTIPLSEFSSVNLASVSTIYVGLGNRDNPSSGGSGTIFLDDIGVGHPTE